MNRRLLLLSSLAAVLAIVLLFDRSLSPPVAEPVVPVSAVEPPAAAPDTDTEALLNPLAGMAPDDFTAMLERPLFNPSRTGRAPEAAAPAPMPAVVEAPPPPETPGPRAEDIALVAISSGPSGRIAALRVSATGEVLYLRAGQPVQSWTVLSVSDRSVVVGTAQSSIELSLFPGKAGASPAQPSAPAEPVIEPDFDASYSEEMSPAMDSGGEQ